MTEPDTELMRLFAVEEAPARDFDFELKVAAGVQRQRLMRDAFDWTLVGFVAAIALWATGPWLIQATRVLLQALGGAAPVIVAISGTALALAAAWFVPDAFEMEPPRD
ncbi:MAG TPA: hypothetical protein VGI79_08125 [Caulobacteraceae bacterium]|jgi:hypothetical protein